MNRPRLSMTCGTLRHSLFLTAVALSGLAGTPLYAQQSAGANALVSPGTQTSNTSSSPSQATQKKTTPKSHIKNIKIKAEGHRRIDENFILARLALREGEKFAPENSTESIRALYQTGQFDAPIIITPTINPDDGTIDVDVSVTVRPLLVGITFEGNNEWVSGTPKATNDYEQGIVDYYNRNEPQKDSSFFNFFRSKLSKECDDVGLSVGKPFNEVLAKRAAFKIKNKYESKYPFAKIKYKVSYNDDEGTARIAFQIEENLETRISRIDFTGNNTFPSHELRNLMSTASWAWTFDPKEWPTFRFLKFSWLSDLGRFQYDKFKRDIDILRKFYQNHGFLDVQIIPPSITYLESGYESVNNEETRGDLPIEIAVIEGLRYTVDSIKIEGNKLGETHARFSDKGIIASIAQYSPRGVRNEGEYEFDHIMVGDYYSPTAVDLAAQKIREYYGQVGYLNCRVEVTREPDIMTGKVAIMFKITENEKSYLRSVKIEGNKITKSEVILRELVLAPGEVFDLVRMKRSELRLRNTSYFRRRDGSSFVTARPVPTGIPGQQDLLISVQEAETGSLSFGGGFSTLDSVSGYVEFSQSNFDLFNYRNYFRGGGQKFRVKVQIGTRSSSIEQSFEEPMVAGRAIAVGYDAYHKSNNYVSSDYTTVDTGIKIYGERRLFERIRGMLYYKIDNYNIKNVDATVPQFIKDEAGYTLLSRAGLRLTRDTRDSYLFPNSGSKIQLTNEVVGGPFGGDCTYYNFNLEAAKWFPIFDYQDQTIKLRGRVQTMHAFSNSYVPFFERIMYGGPYNLRGFRYAYVSPFQGDEPMGGCSGAYVSAEYMIKLIDIFRFVLFYDGGYVNTDSFDFSPREWNDNYGFGFRIIIMGALLNIDLGFPIHTSEKNDDGMRFNFSFGTSF